MELVFLFPDRPEVDQNNFIGLSGVLTVKGILVLECVDVDVCMAFFSGEDFLELHEVLLE